MFVLHLNQTLWKKIRIQRRHMRFQIMGINQTDNFITSSVRVLCVLVLNKNKPNGNWQLLNKVRIALKLPITSFKDSLITIWNTYYDVKKIANIFMCFNRTNDLIVIGNSSMYLSGKWKCSVIIIIIISST